MAQDERIKNNEWDVTKRCPICADIADNGVNLEGEQIFVDESKTQPEVCPSCQHEDVRFFHGIAGVESNRTSTRGDTQPWAHQLVVKCMSCERTDVVRTNPCLGNPWEEIMGFARPLMQSDEMKRKIRFSNEQAVGLRGAHEKYEKDTKLLDKGFKSKRSVGLTEEADSVTTEATITWEPTDEEKKLPKFKQNDKKKKSEDD